MTVQDFTTDWHRHGHRTVVVASRTYSANGASKESRLLAPECSQPMSSLAAMSEDVQRLTLSFLPATTAGRVASATRVFVVRTPPLGSAA